MIIPAIMDKLIVKHQVMLHIQEVSQDSLCHGWEVMLIRIILYHIQEDYQGFLNFRLEVFIMMQKMLLMLESSINSINIFHM